MQQFSCYLSIRSIKLYQHMRIFSSSFQWGDFVDCYEKSYIWFWCIFLFALCLILSSLKRKQIKYIYAIFFLTIFFCWYNFFFCFCLLKMIEKIRQKVLCFFCLWKFFLWMENPFILWQDHVGRRFSRSWYADDSWQINLEYTSDFACGEFFLFNQKSPKFDKKSNFSWIHLKLKQFSNSSFNFTLKPFWSLQISHFPSIFRKRCEEATKNQWKLNYCNVDSNKKALKHNGMFVIPI